MINKKKIILITLNIPVTADDDGTTISNAKKIVTDDGGYFDEKIGEKHHYLLIYISNFKLKLISGMIRFISCTDDVTDEIVNDRIKTKELELFDLAPLYQSYKDYYFENVTIYDIKEKQRVRGVTTINNFDFKIMENVKGFELFSSKKVNELLASGFSKRNFTEYRDCKEPIDLQFYYSNVDIAKIGYKNEQKFLKIELFYYSGNKEEFEHYIFIAMLTSGRGFTSISTLDARFLYVEMVIGRMFNDLDILDIVKDEIELNITK